MKSYRGFAPLLVILVIVVVGGGATYAVVNRAVLKSYFETGDKPTANQFADTVDSEVNLTISTSDNKKVYTPAEAGKAMMFRWDSDAGAGAGAEATYRLKVWQLMQGQTGTAAMKGEPVVTKEVTGTTGVSVSGLYTGPCKPPYLCDFVWSVELVGKDGVGTGASAPASFSITVPATVETTIKQETEVDGSAAAGTR